MCGIANGNDLNYKVKQTFAPYLSNNKLSIHLQKNFPKTPLFHLALFSKYITVSPHVFSRTSSRRRDGIESKNTEHEIQTVHERWRPVPTLETHPLSEHRIPVSHRPSLAEIVYDPLITTGLASSFVIRFREKSNPSIFIYIYIYRCQLSDRCNRRYVHAWGGRKEERGG